MFSSEYYTDMQRREIAKYREARTWSETRAQYAREMVFFYGKLKRRYARAGR